MSKKHLNRVAQLPCAICGAQPVEVHHMREGDAAGASQRASDWLVIPLCPDCHRGRDGVHGNKSRLRLLNMTEHELLAQTLERIYG